MELDNLLKPRIPCSTYRLQMNAQFTFRDAVSIVPYLHELGISDIYASPYLKARKGSLHGYDIVDPNRLNPEVGDESDYDAFMMELGARGMGQILDVVPNHMCIESEENRWWFDVLESGPSSIYAHVFDIDWEPVKQELRHKLLIPILGDQYGEALEKGDIRLSLESGAIMVNYFGHRFPLAPKSYMAVLSYRTETLRDELTGDNPAYMELLSILTSLKYLPEYTDRSPENVVERNREKEIIKKRLGVLCAESPRIENFLKENIDIFNGQIGDPRSFDLLDRLLDKQIYRLSHWRVATEEINYRRFFDINSLGAIRIENRRVFDETHRFVLELIKKGRVTGLRIDHPDGLYNPREYFETLQRQCFLQTRLAHVERLQDEITLPYGRNYIETEIMKRYDEMVSADPQWKPFYIVGEKILIKSERMPEDWPIFSTTGYVFLNSLNGIFIDGRNEKDFDRIYERFVKERKNCQEILYEKKKLIMDISMSSEINMLGHYLNILSEKDRRTRDFTLNNLTDALKEVIAFFPVYRTYINSYEVGERDRQYVEVTIGKARKKNLAVSGTIFDFIRNVLLLKFPDHFGTEDMEQWLDFVMRFQQITGPVMAKGVEDTAFYTYNRFVSLNEVGGYPEKFGTSLETFHGQNIERIKFWPRAMITTATHDTKRGEDVRARINVLSEIPERWKESVTKWSRLNRRAKIIVDGRRVPDPNEEYLFYQTLVGTWPLEWNDPEAYDLYRKRIREYMVKATRESKENTSWINPNGIYEDALEIFVDTVTSRAHRNEFLNDFLPFVEDIAHWGMYNSLSQVLLKMAAPGIPDFYQGNEFWDFSLVDPDNRRPVDYALRMGALTKLAMLEKELSLTELAGRLMEERKNGLVKMYVTCKALRFRNKNRRLFEEGRYIPLELIGDQESSACAFARQIAGTTVMVVAPRFFTRLSSLPGELPCGEKAWGNTMVAIPQGMTGTRYRNIFTGEIVESHDDGNTVGFRMGEVMRSFPVAFLEHVE